MTERARTATGERGGGGAVCVDCGCATRPQMQPGPGSGRRGAARGLCSVCYDRRRRAGTLADFERRSWPAGELLGEWELLRDGGCSVARAADRLGITRAALERALYRAAARGDSRGRRTPFGRAS